MRCKEVEVVLTGEAGSATGAVTITFPPSKLSGLQLKLEGQPEGVTVTMVAVCAGIAKTLLTRISNHDLPLCAMGEDMLDEDGTLIEVPGVLIEPRLNGPLTITVTNGDPGPVMCWLLVTY